MTNHLFTIGISQYPNYGDLNNASKDAKALSGLLLAEFDFLKENYTELLDENGTYNDLIYHLDSLVQNLTQTDNLVIVFCGHGEFDPVIEEGFWIPHEGRLGNKATYIPITVLEKYIKAVKAHHVLIISDSCFSGSLFRSSTEPNETSERLDKISSKWALTSGRIQRVSDGIMGKNSPFTLSLLNNLKDHNNKPIGISELVNKVKKEVGETKNQIPRGEPLQNLGHKGGEFVFYPKSYKKIEEKIKVVKNSGIPQNIIELYKQFSESESKMLEKVTKAEYLEAAKLRDEKNVIKKSLDIEIKRNLEEYKFERINSGITKIDLSRYNEFKSTLHKLRKEKNNVVRSQNYTEAAKLRAKERKLINENKEQFGYLLVEFRENSIPELADIYNLYSYVKFYLDVLPFETLYKVEPPFDNVLLKKYYIEIIKKISPPSFQIELSEKTIDAEILKLFDTLEY